MKKGFTLLELLVVISLIGLLTTIAVVSFQGTNQRARDGKRKADLEQIRTALEISRSNSGTNTYPTALSELVTELYLTVLPTDPKTFTYVYSPGSDFRTYTLCVHLEQGDTSDACGGTAACGAVCNYSTKNP